MNEQTLVEKKRNGPSRGGAGGAKKSRCYTVAEKLKAVRLCLEEGFSQQQVCDEMGMALSGLNRWVIHRCPFSGIGQQALGCLLQYSLVVWSLSRLSSNCRYMQITRIQKKK